MITRFAIKNFKGFKNFSIELTKINLLVGSNNSGKTTIFHALQFFFWCLEQIAQKNGSTILLKKTQLPEVGAVPYFILKDLFHKQKMREGRKPARITLELKCERVPRISIDIYPAFSRNIMINGRDISVSPDHYRKIVQLKPVFIPSTVGIISREELCREIAQERLVFEGRHNQVLRNMVLRLFKSKRLWKLYTNLMQPLFKLSNISVPFDDKKDEWLTALYGEEDCRFDYISAGSGFLQVSNILAFLLLNKSAVALLDEPDAHMHDDLQKIIFDILCKVAAKRNLQLLISTHSPTLIEAAGTDSVLVVDRKQNEPLKAGQLHELGAMLAQYGISLSTRNLYDTFIDCKVLFVEGVKDDFDNFMKVVGGIYDPSFLQITRKVVVLGTGGATKEWPIEAIQAFKQIVGKNISHLLIADRDFKTQEEMNAKVRKAEESGIHVEVLRRRNRESYLLEPKILSRLLKKKFHKNKKAIPAEFSEKGMEEFILKEAGNLRNETHAKFFTEHPVHGSHDEEVEKRTNLETYFMENYDQCLEKKRIPFLLMDSKEVLLRFRKHIGSNFKISFSDTEILQEYRASELPTDLKEVMGKILNVFE